MLWVAINSKKCRNKSSKNIKFSSPLIKLLAKIREVFNGQNVKREEERERADFTYRAYIVNTKAVNF